MCPGKNMAAGRDGKSYQRDITIDVINYAQVSNIKLIICLLNDYEIRSIGCDVNRFKRKKIVKLMNLKIIIDI